MLYALLALCLFGGASAQLFGLWSCPEAVKPMAHFHMEQLTGQWFKVRKYPLMNAALSYCPWVSYELVGTDKLKVVHGAYYARQTIQVRLRGEAFLKKHSEPGGLSARMVTDNYVRDYWVLDTDYNTYVVIYSCRNFFVFHLKYLFIFTKDPTPSNDVLSRAEDVLDNNQLRTTKLETIDRGSCIEVDKLRED